MLLLRSGKISLTTGEVISGRLAVCFTSLSLWNHLSERKACKGFIVKCSKEFTRKFHPITQLISMLWFHLCFASHRPWDLAATRFLKCPASKSTWPWLWVSLTRDSLTSLLLEDFLILSSFLATSLSLPLNFLRLIMRILSQTNSLAIKVSSLTWILAHFAIMEAKRHSSGQRNCRSFMNKTILSHLMLAPHLANMAGITVSTQQCTVLPSSRHQPILLFRKKFLMIRRVGSQIVCAEGGGLKLPKIASHRPADGTGLPPLPRDRTGRRYEDSRVRV